MVDSSDQVGKALATVEASVLDPKVIMRQAQGMAYQVVAQACGLAVQDAENWLRNFMVLANAASGKFLADFVTTKDPQDLIAIEAIQKAVGDASTKFEQIGADSAKVVKEWPHGA